MKINSRSRIAINAMLDVAINGAHVPVALAGIGERQNVSLSYLEQLFRRLRMRGFVKSARGPGGGYQLNKRLSAISVADIVEAVDALEGGGSSKRRTREASAVDELWARLDQRLLDYLRTITLESILQQLPATPAAQPRTSHSAIPGGPTRREQPRDLAVA